VDKHNSSKKRKSNAKDSQIQRSILQWETFNIHGIVPTQPAVFEACFCKVSVWRLQRMYIGNNDLRLTPEKARPYLEHGSGRQDPLAHHRTLPGKSNTCSMDYSPTSLACQCIEYSTRSQADCGVFHAYDLQVLSKDPSCITTGPNNQETRHVEPQPYTYGQICGTGAQLCGLIRKSM
jgi:hypothetical protein